MWLRTEPVLNANDVQAQEAEAARLQKKLNVSLVLLLLVCYW